MAIPAIRAIAARPRLFAAAVLGLVIGVALPVWLHPLTRTLLGWDTACLSYLILCAWMFSTPRPGGIEADAERQEDGEWTIFWLTVAAVSVSFAAIIGEFSAAKGVHAGLRIGLVATTLFLSWLMTHTLFALRYAHEYYELVGPDGAVARGLAFPEDEVPDYWDFFYFSLVLGMTFQVSDVQITSRKLRRLAAAHGLLGFLFNTVILALSVNIGAGLL